MRQFCASFTIILIFCFYTCSRQQSVDYQQQQQLHQMFLTPEQQQQLLRLHSVLASLAPNQQTQLTSQQRQFLGFLQRYLYGAQQQQQQHVTFLQQLRTRATNNGLQAPIKVPFDTGISISTIPDPDTDASQGETLISNLRNLPYQEMKNLIMRFPSSTDVVDQPAFNNWRNAPENTPVSSLAKDPALIRSQSLPPELRNFFDSRFNPQSNRLNLMPQRGFGFSGIGPFRSGAVVENWHVCLTLAMLFLIMF